MTYSNKCIVVKDGVDKCYRSYDGSYKVTSWLGLGIGYGSSVYDIFQDCVFRNSNIWDPEYRPEDFVYYVGEVSDYYAMENGSVTIRMKSCKAPSVQFKFTSNIPDGVVFGTMKYTYQKQSGSTTMCTRSWSLNNSDEITFDRNPGLMTQVLDGTWWSGKEQMDFVLTWERGPEANSFITTHKNVTLRKTVYIDNDKNYIINLRFRGQSDSDPEIWIGVDVDPDHSGDLDEEDDSNE